MDEGHKSQPASEVQEVVATEKLFGQCFEASRIDKGAAIPVGGGSIFSDEVNVKVVGDFEALEPTLREMHETAGKYNLPELQKWLQSQGIPIDEQLFAKLFVFTKTLEKRYPAGPDALAAREGTYSKSGNGTVKLSELFAANRVACAEIAALAQYYLQQAGIDSRFFSGDALWDRSHEFSEKHSFIVIPQADKQLIFDPANPTSTTQGLFPSVYTIGVDFEQAVRKNQKAFVPANNVLSKEVAYFGVNNGTNVTQQSFVTA